MTNTNKIILAIILIAFSVWLASNFTESDQPSESFWPVSNLEESDQPLESSDLPEERCHPSYSGCLNPDASDYDCAGGSGNGPYYTGTVRVIGPDVFDLDRDGDGWGCE
jgi:hypothetical protein